ncbi:hypothetical protein DY000_02026549 [Brassica cretica]|uniref:Uncharacterized protein n=1 Tax=Brassica cretica TaxID=69181 RepID=A0ABQ7E7Y2_BRACR|nr:hypothetical protein DY000_02026549 [Brassica cretica]
MKFSETFGCVWSSKESDTARSLARVSHPSRSDLPKRHPDVARFSMARRHEAKPGATSQSDPLRSLPKPGATLPERRT